MLGKPMEEKETKTCWQRGIGQPLGMAIGSAINLGGATASLIISARGGAVNPLPFICTSMFTSGLYFTTNGVRFCQIWYETRAERSLSHAERVQRERDKITVAIEK